MLKQIILISDGQSNTGPNPANIAELALEKSIIVNTIGIVDSKENQSSIFELEEIAERGGGVCDFTTDIDTLREKVEILETGGTTLTGFAIEGAIEIFEENKEYFIYDNIV